jgi:hypothetical protein
MSRQTKVSEKKNKSLKTWTNMVIKKRKEKQYVGI